MVWILSAAVSVAAMPAVWSAFKFLVNRWVPPQHYGLIYLRLQLQELDVDVENIPQATLVRIVETCLDGVAMQKTSRAGVEDFSQPEWKINFAVLLRHEAFRIREAMNGRGGAFVILA